MAYDEFLSDRIRITLKTKAISFKEKKMMGGLTFMVDNKMCVGIIKNDLIIRSNPINHEELLKIEGVKPMDFTGRVLKGFVLIEPNAIDLDEDLEKWIQVAIDYNPQAKSSKKKKS